MMFKPKRIVRISAVLIIVGLIVAGIGFASAKFDIKNLPGVTTEDHEVSIPDDESITTLNVDLNYSDIIITFDAEATKISATYQTDTTGNGKLLNEITTSVENNALTIIEDDTWYANALLWHYYNPTVRIVIPADRTVALNVTLDSNDLEIIGNATLSSATIETDSGDIKTTEATISSSGDISIEVDTGKVKLGKLTANKLAIDTDSGDVKLSDITVNSITVDTDSGKVRFGKTSVNGELEIESDSGDIDFTDTVTANIIKIELDSAELDCSGAVITAKEIKLITDSGEVDLVLSGAKSEYSIYLDLDSASANVPSQSGSTDKTITIKSDSGDIDLEFIK